MTSFWCMHHHTVMHFYSPLFYSVESWVWIHVLSAAAVSVSQSLEQDYGVKPSSVAHICHADQAKALAMNWSGASCLTARSDAYIAAFGVLAEALVAWLISAALTGCHRGWRQRMREAPLTHSRLMSSSLWQQSHHKLIYAGANSW